MQTNTVLHMLMALCALNERETKVAQTTVWNQGDEVTIGITGTKGIVTETDIGQARVKFWNKVMEREEEYRFSDDALTLTSPSKEIPTTKLESWLYLSDRLIARYGYEDRELMALRGSLAQSVELRKLGK